LALKFTYYYKLFKESKYLLFLNVIEQLFFFLVFLVFARKYPVETYGELITLFTLANVFITLLNFGLPIYLQREAAFAKENINGLFSRIITINIFVLAVYLLFTFSYYRLFYFSLSYKLFIVTVIPVYLYSNINILNSVLSGLGKYRIQFFSFLNSRVITIVSFILAAFLFKLSLPYLLVIYSLGFLYQIFLLLNKIKKENISISLNYNLTELLAVLKLSYPLGMAVIFNYVYDKIDILMISKMTDYSQVGFYNIGYGIYKASSIAFSFLLVSGLTRVSYLSRRKEAVKLFFRKYAFGFLFIGIVINVLLFLFSDLLVKIVYTEKFMPSALILKIVSFAVIGLALNNLTGVILNGLGLYRENMYVTFTGLVINVILNFIFIPVYGIIAAALISIITEYFIFLGDYFFIKQHLK
jgi:O-antigen/teichoic acid export membrane protein